MGRDFELEVLCETVELPEPLALELLNEEERAELVVVRRGTGDSDPGTAASQGSQEPLATSLSEQREN